MARAIRYRTGVDARTVKPLTGFPHVQQSLAFIWMTRTNTMAMLLDYGSDLRGNLAEDLTPALALDIYDDFVTAAHRWEPEYRLMTLRFVSLTEQGALGLAYSGIYFPEGRFNNYNIAEHQSVSALRVGTLAGLGAQQVAA